MYFNGIRKRKIWQSFGILLLFNLSVVAQQWAWKDFSPANSGWRVLAPGPLQPDSEAQKRSSKGSYIYNDNQGFFAVIYQQYSSWDWFTQKSRFNKQRDMVVKANNGQLVKDVEISNRGMVGREVEVKFAAGTLTQIEGPSVMKYRVQRFRMFFQGKKFFIVLAVLPENDVNKPEIDNFFNSFSVNSEPEAEDNNYTTDEDSPLTVSATNGILANDSDRDQDRLSVAQSRPVPEPANGTLAVNADGSFTYTPKPNFSGRDTFTYRASDGVAESETATVTINVNPVNDAPTIANVPATLTLDEMTPVRFNAVGSDVDNPVGSLRYSLGGAPEGASINPQTGEFSWTASELQGPGTHSFKVNVTDGKAMASAAVSVIVNEVNAPPVFNSLPSGAINELEAYNFAVKASDSDFPAQSLKYALRDAPEGVSIDQSTGVLNWTPREAQGDGSDYKFTVTVSDGEISKEGLVSLNVKEVNSAPRLEQVADRTANELETLSLRLQAADDDLPANGISYSLDSKQPGMTIDPRTGEISWKPGEAEGPGDYTVTVRATDTGTPQLSDSKTFKLRINEVNSAPKLRPVSDQTINEESALAFEVAADDPDLPKNILRYSLLNGPEGAVLDASSGKLSWTPSEMQGPGTYKLTIKVFDNGTPELSDEQTMTVRVNEVNKAPVASDGAIAGDEDAPVSITVSATDADLPANNLTYTMVGAPAHGTVSGNGSTFTYTPNKDFNGSDTFTFKTNDGTIDSNVARIRIEIRPVNDQPVANEDAATSDAAAIDVKVLENDKDIDGDRLILTRVGSANGGKAEISGDVIRFTPDKDFVGTVTIEYEVSDQKGGTAKGLLRITVNAVKPN